MMHKGFTLIEIMLVLVIMTVLAAMVAPNFFAATQADSKTEARFMQKILRLASEEAQLTSKPVRCSVYPNQLVFESPTQDGRWLPIQASEFQQDLPKPPVEVLSVHLDGDIPLDNAVDTGTAQGNQAPPLARLMFWADGHLTAAQIKLGIPQHHDAITLSLQAGAGGIHVLSKP